MNSCLRCSILTRVRPHASRASSTRILAYTPALTRDEATRRRARSVPSEMFATFQYQPKSWVHNLDVQTQAFSTVRSESTTPKYAALIRRAAVEERNPERAEELFNKMYQESIKIPKIRLNVNLLMFVMNAWCAAKEPERAELILKRAQQLFDDNVLRKGPDLTNYGAVIDCWAKSDHSGRAERAEALLRYLQGRKDLQPDEISYNCVMNAYAQRGMPEKTEALLEEMYKAFQEGKLPTKPNVRSFSVLLNAWSKSRHPDAPDKIEQLLRRMRQNYESGMMDSKPNVVSYGVAIDALAKSSAKDSAVRAEAILRETQERYKAGEQDVRPNDKTWTSVLNAWAKRGRPDRAEALLYEMRDDYLSGNEDAKPTASSFCAVLDAWARSNLNHAPQRAEAILTRMGDHWINGNFDCKPDVVSYNVVLNCWARSPREDAAERANALLQKMKDLYQSGETLLQPNLISYNCVMDAWARRGKPKVVESLFEEMENEYRNGNKAAKPDERSYSVIVKAWSKSDVPDATERAEAAFSNIPAYIKQNNYTYGTIIECLAKSTQPGSSERAEALLREMQSLHQGGNPDVNPGVEIFTMVMNAWARQRKAERAEALLWETYDRYKNGNQPNRPDTLTFNLVLDAWSKSSASDAAHKADILLRRMQDLANTNEPDCKPNIISYNKVMECWARSEDKDKSLSSIISLFNEMVAPVKALPERVAPDVTTYTHFLKTVASSRVKDKKRRAETVLALMKKNGVKPNKHTVVALKACGLDAR